MIKGPSLDAIRRFKEQQERKKREEDERKAQEKLSTLEHRASQGDRKAKHELRIIEKVREERNKAPELQTKVNPGPSSLGKKLNDKSKSSTSVNSRIKPPKKQETDFDELMKLAKQNTNEIKKPKPEPKIQLPSIPKKRDREGKVVENTRPDIPAVSKSKPSSQAKVVAPRPKSNNSSGSNMVIEVERHHNRLPSSTQQQSRRAMEIKKQQELQRRIELYKMRGGYGGHHSSAGEYYDDDEDDDEEYESDGFVVEEEDASLHDDGAQDELRNTLRSLFNYDKRRCDRREEEIDRQYRQIGKVATFEDLEREERRATRLAAEEDARELRKEDERKRLKKLRLQKSQK